MSFIMPKDIPAGEAPVPNDPRVDVSDVDDGEILAVREFLGEVFIKLRHGTCFHFIHHLHRYMY